MIPQRDRFLFRISDKTYIHIGKNVFTFNSNSEIIKYKADIRNDNDFELRMLMMINFYTISLIINIHLLKIIKNQNKKTNMINFIIRKGWMVKNY